MSSFWDNSRTYKDVLIHFGGKENDIVKQADFDLDGIYSEVKEDGTIELFSSDKLHEIASSLILDNCQFNGYDKDLVEGCGIIDDIADNISDYEDLKDVQDYIDSMIDEYADDF